MKYRGFTLVEVLIAMTLVVVGLVLIAQAFSAGLKAMGASDQSTVARFLLEQKLAEFESLPFTSLQSDEGDFGDDYPDYRWVAEVETTDLANLVQMNLSVYWKRNNSETSLTVTRLFAERGITSLTDGSSEGSSE